METETLDKLYLEWSQFTKARTHLETQLRDALRLADEAINPPDKSGISLNEWNERLKRATEKIRFAVAKF